MGLRMLRCLPPLTQVVSIANGSRRVIGQGLVMNPITIGRDEKPHLHCIINHFRRIIELP
jgi:hypothetical protein